MNADGTSQSTSTPSNGTTPSSVQGEGSNSGQGPSPLLDVDAGDSVFTFARPKDIRDGLGNGVGNILKGFFHSPLLSYIIDLDRVFL